MFRIDAQVSWSVSRLPRYLTQGIAEDVDGYLLIRKRDAERAGYTPQAGDKISQIGRSAEANLYVTEAKPAAHYSEQDGPTLIFVFFSHRRPASGRVGKGI